jgi:hypothetical protein
LGAFCAYAFAEKPITATTSKNLIVVSLGYEILDHEVASVFGSSAASASLRMLGTERRKWATSLRRTKSRIPASTFAAALRLPLRMAVIGFSPFSR